LCTQFNCKSHRRNKQLIPIVILLISSRAGMYVKRFAKAFICFNFISIARCQLQIGF
jgi:hypothetical protein